MLDIAKMDTGLPQSADAEDVQIGALLAACDRHPAAPLMFAYDGQPIRPGYHVTAVKAGQFAALDCGGIPKPGRKSSFSFGT